MQSLNYKALEATISPERLKPYRLLADDSNQLVIDRYHWNVVLSEALYPSLKVCEITLRNRVHHTASSIWGQKWLLSNALSDVREQRKVQEAIETLKNENKPADPDRVVAALVFGFWTSLFSHHYGNRFSTRILGGCFPNLPSKERQRATVAGKITPIRFLRNRVFHYEPIWKYMDLLHRHAQIVQMIQWMCTDTASWVNSFDRFPSVHHAFTASKAYPFHHGQ